MRRKKEIDVLLKSSEEKLRVLKESGHNKAIAHAEGFIAALTWTLTTKPKK